MIHSEKNIPIITRIVKGFIPNTIFLPVIISVSKAIKETRNIIYTKGPKRWYKKASFRLKWVKATNERVIPQVGQLCPVIWWNLQVMIPAGAGLIINGKRINPKNTAARNILIRQSAGLIFEINDIHFIWKAYNLYTFEGFKVQSSRFQGPLLNP